MLVLGGLHPLPVCQLLTLPGIQGIQGCILTGPALKTTCATIESAHVPELSQQMQCHTMHFGLSQRSTSMVCGSTTGDRIYELGCTDVQGSVVVMLS